MSNGLDLAFVGVVVLVIGGISAVLVREFLRDARDSVQRNTRREE